MAMEIFKLVGRITYEGQQTVEKGLDNLGKKIKGAEDKLAKFGDKAQAVGKKTTEIGAGITKLTAPIVAVGAIAFASALDYEKAMSTIRAGTGATGDDLQALGDDFKAVFKTVPQGTDEVATALADLNTRTGATGEDLQELTKQFLDLGRVSGDDVPTLIAKGTRAFGDWNVATEDQADTLDYFWKVAQTTGIGVTDLMEQVTATGAPMRQLGFSLEETAALFGKWEKEGVNSSVVMSGFRRALSGFAADNKEPQEELMKTFDAINAAATAGEANSIAMETFGAKAGPDLAAAIREGRFSIDDLLATLNESTETIAAAGEETMTFGDKMTLMKNKVMAAIEPLGTIILEMVEQIFPVIESAIERLSNWFGSLTGSQKQWIVILGLAAAALGPLLMIVGALISAVGTIASAIAAVGLVTAGWIVAIVAIVAALAILYAKFEPFRTIVNAVFGAIVSTVQTAMGVVVGFVQEKLAVLRQFWEENGVQIMQAVTNAFNMVKSVIDFIMPAILFVITMVWNNIKGLITGVLNVIMGAVKIFSGLFTGDFSKMWEGVKQLFFGALQAIWNFINLMLIGRMLSVIKSFVLLGRNLFVGFGKSLVTTTRNMWNTITGAVKGAINGVLGFFRNMVTNAVIIFRLLRSMGSSIFGAIRSTITSIASNIFSRVVQTFRNLQTGAVNTFNSLRSRATSIFNSVKNAIQNPIRTAADFVKRQIDKIKGFFNNMRIKFPKIKLPHFSLSGSFNLAKFQVPKLSVDWYKKGGVFGGASVIGVGEEPGVSEAVIPLKQDVLAGIGKGIAAASAGFAAPASDNGDKVHYNHVHVYIGNEQIAEYVEPAISEIQGNGVRSTNRIWGEKE